MIERINQRVKVVFPSLITLTSLFFGFYSIIVCISMLAVAYQNVGLDEKTFLVGRLIALAATFIVVGCVMDTLDGNVARKLGVSSELGKNLDSLSDFVTFGVAPGILFFATLPFTDQNPLGIGVYRSSPWLEHLLSVRFFPIFLAFVVPFAAVYRLAKFNVMETHGNYFIGTPSPFAGATIAMIFSFNYQGTVGGRLLTEAGLFERFPSLLDVPLFFERIFSNYHVLIVSYIILGLFMVVRVRYVRFNEFLSFFCRNRASYFALFLFIVFFFKYAAVVTAFAYIVHPPFLGRFLDYREVK